MNEVKLSEGELEALLVEISTSLGLSVAETLSLYVYYGNDLFFLIHFLRGKTIRFPTKSPVAKFLDKLGEFTVLKIDHFVTITDPVCECSINLLNVNSIFSYEQNKYQLCSKPFSYSDHYLAIVKIIKEK